MFSKNNLVFLAIALIFSNLLNGTVKKKFKRVCTSQKRCVDINNRCLCYCSGIGALRRKKNDDKPIYVENDPNEVYCYCKQWDLDNYPGPVARD